MKTAKISDYRSHLSDFHKRIVSHNDPLRISSSMGDLVVLPADDYESMVETLYILRDKKTIQSLNAIRSEIKSGKLKGFSIDQAFKDVVGCKNK